jgi:hypothetical protein
MKKDSSLKIQNDKNKKRLIKKELAEDIEAIRLFENDEKKVMRSEKIIKTRLGL